MAEHSTAPFALYSTTAACALPGGAVSPYVTLVSRVYHSAFAPCITQRFWVLETVARMPYFSYISILHLYESLGWWRAGAELRKVHFAEEWNELHHLQVG